MTKWLKRGHVKNIPLLNLELWKDFFAKNIPKTPKIELRQAPNMLWVTDYCWVPPECVADSTTQMCCRQVTHCHSMSWVERFPQRHNSIFYAEINDHGVCRGNTGWILAQWWRPVPVVSRVVALDLPYWVMRSAPYCLIRMAIEMAREAGPFFSVVDFMSCITVAKWPSYGLLKIKPSYTTVCHYVYIQFIYYGDPPTPIAMNAVLAIIASGGRAIIVIYREGVEINPLFYWFY